MHRSLSSLERVEPEEFSRRVSSKLGEDARDVSVRFGQVVATVAKDRVVDVLLSLKSDADIACDFFTFLSAIDWQENGFEVLITVFSTRFSNTVILKIPLAAGDERFPTVTGVFRGASWHERECSEMFGITFEGTPNPDKLYLAEDFVGHPLRKDFKLASRTYKQWPGAKDPEEAAGGGR